MRSHAILDVWVLLSIGALHAAGALFFLNANHFAFMIMQCRPAFEQNDPEEIQAICGDAPGFDRFEFHDRLNQNLIRFFSDALMP